jgi:two-component system, NtrC family, sensor kinase
MSASVLVVDDSLTVRMDLVEALEAAGFRCLPCATAAQARLVLAGERVDLVVLDVLLPDADGVELLKEIRASPGGADIPVLMLSSEAEVKDRIRGLRTGADEYVGKPYDTSYMVSRAQELVRERRGESVPALPTILVIDDSPTFREELRGALLSDGYQVLTAASGEEGLRVAADRRPSAILVDGVLPGLDGGSVIRHVRLDAALRRTPCILLTASEHHGAELRALDAGADAFVRKDDDVKVILARLRAVLRAVGTGDSEAVGSLLGPKKILAVDDSLTYLHELAGALRTDGYDVVLAHSGEEALDMLAVQPVDCILLDVLMPGLGGKETCGRIKAAPAVRDIPLIMLTALEDREAMIDGLSTGADDYIPKSSEFEVLRARVRAQIRRKQFEDENRRIREELLRKELEAAEARAARELAGARAVLIAELERKNNELEAFSYSVSHDLRAPLRAINGFSRILLEDCADMLDDAGKGHLRHLCAASERMGQLIDDLLALSRIGRAELVRAPVNLSELADLVVDALRKSDPQRVVQADIEQGLVVEADSRLLRVALENLLGNAWKFTAKVAFATIELRAERGAEGTVYRLRDNGAGFDQAYAKRLFQPFQRLHSEAEFSGTGIGLATVHRVVDRHGGRVWAEGTVGSGATIYFTLPADGHGASAFPGQPVMRD